MKKDLKKTNTQFWGTGRRKSCTARVFIVAGDGQFTVNGRSLAEYFGGRESAKIVAQQPFAVLELAGKFNVFVNVDGGGVMGQAYAIRHGLTRALLTYEAATTVKDKDDQEDLGIGSGNASSNKGRTEYRAILRTAGFVTRDSRKVERKKVGQPKARKKVQYSKR